MGHLRIRGGFAWSADDEATFRRWRRAVCLFYGGIVLVLAAICVAHPAANDGHKSVASAAHPALD